MQIHKIAWLVLFFTLTGYAQKYELGKVTTKELEEKRYPLDTTAAAAITYTKGRTYFRYTKTRGFTSYHEYEFRIKIYKMQGLKWANFEVPYYVGYENTLADYVKFSEGVTYNLENGQIVKTKLTGEGTFKKDVNEFWNVASIAMPNVKPGSVIEFKYTYKSDDLGDFPEFHFQYDIPVKHAEYLTEIPEFYIYKPVIIGFGDVKSDAKIVSGYQNFTNEHQQTVNLSFQQINASYVSDNVPAMQNEAFVDNRENYRSSVLHELEKTRFPEQPEKNYSTTWEGVSQSIFKYKAFGKELEERQYFEQDLPAVLRSSTTDLEKAAAILGHVKRNVKWDGKYGYNTRKGVRKAYTEKTGNVAEVNFILISMLNHAGINANPVLVSTVSNGVPAYPNTRVFNYVVAAAQIDGKQLLLDATDDYTAVNILPSRALNWTGRLIRRDGTSQEIGLVPTASSREMYMVAAKLEADGKISGKTRVNKTDYAAFAFREKYAKASQADYIEQLENQLGDVKISDYTSENRNEPAKPMTETFTFASDNHVEIIGDKMYVSPLLLLGGDKNPFVSETRKLPIYYGYPKQVKYNINIEIPQGYAVESLPKPINIATGENVGTFQFNILQTENKIQVTVAEEITAALVSAAFYEPMREFYRKMIEKQNEKIVLKKM